MKHRQGTSPRLYASFISEGRRKPGGTDDQNYTTISGKIVQLSSSQTQYGLRAQAMLEAVDWSTGEVTQTKIVAWKDDAAEIIAQGLQKDVGVRGYLKENRFKVAEQFNVVGVSPIRLIDPNTIDLSKYL